MLLKILKYGFLFTILILLTIFAMDYWVKKSTATKLFSSTKDIPENKVGLVLGTRKILRGSYVNPYYAYRIDAAEQLFKAGKVEFLLLSGDNGSKTYDEPTTMKKDLVARGIPEEKIFLDYAGFRTLDSVVRANAIFGQEKFTIISQPFHNERAIFIADQKGLNTVGFNAQKVGRKFGWKTLVREKLARVKLLLDLIIGKQPKFLGDRIEIE
ncbi:MAG: ElyC/SanA/YdcF family protein [Bacteroidota bacterium]